MDGSLTTECSTLSVTVLRARVAADGVRHLTLGTPDGVSLPPWRAGAHLDVLLPSGIERQYSLCGAEHGLWDIAVLRAPDSRGGSSWLHDSIAEGDTITVRGPRNRFPLVHAQRYLLIAGGIGITPILAMLRELEASGRTAWRLTYGGRARASMAFLAELAPFGDRVMLWPEDERGRIDVDGLLAAPETGTAIYCCGPEPLLKAVEDASRPWPSGSLHLERFNAVAVEAAPDDKPFEVLCARSGITVQVPVGESILEMLENEGINVPMACGEGVCGSCETRVLQGTPDHRDVVLSQDERAAGDVMMVCCSRTNDDRIVLDL